MRIVGARNARRRATGKGVPLPQLPHGPSWSPSRPQPPRLSVGLAGGPPPGCLPGRGQLRRRGLARHRPLGRDRALRGRSRRRVLRRASALRGRGLARRARLPRRSGLARRGPGLARRGRPHRSLHGSARRGALRSLVGRRSLHRPPRRRPLGRLPGRSSRRCGNRHRSTSLSRSTLTRGGACGQPSHTRPASALLHRLLAVAVRHARHHTRHHRPPSFRHPPSAAHPVSRRRCRTLRRVERPFRAMPDRHVILAVRPRTHRPYAHRASRCAHSPLPTVCRSSIRRASLVLIASSPCCGDLAALGAARGDATSSASPAVSRKGGIPLDLGGFPAPLCDSRDLLAAMSGARRRAARGPLFRCRR